MEGVKEKWRQDREEKDSNEAEDGRRSDTNDEEDDESSEVAALVWQEGYDEDNLSFPIMHWEALSLRIAELEKQEELKKEQKAKLHCGVSLERGRSPLLCAEERGRRADRWDDAEDACNSHVLTLTSRLQTQMNLQLCFINNSESEDEEEPEVGKKEPKNTQKGTVQVQQNPQPPAKTQNSKFGGLKNTLKNLRARMRTDNRTLAATCSDPVVQRRHLERSDLQNYTIKDLNAVCTSLSQAIQELSSELVGLLQVRDQLRTEQDAMLLEIQDLTSL
ncbi:schwannomin-interacting protein 1 [Takifugu flavidus]|uniref:IQCJ-SCHIP1 readthrough transcript protein n=2 Tax=Takifugu TaxID=31032 RepID=A0A5C6N870_9TELE|nr:schwannomin-interacting protein 1 [Takifugu flavidus]TNM93452.1 hypothetical protein fugu_001628 [Takifugu bimaculatus]TWW63684.1 IQCJ-SCHIP1 readthrough transcript protein [Takifugu flavidus]